MVGLSALSSAHRLEIGSVLVMAVQSAYVLVSVCDLWAPMSACESGLVSAALSVHGSDLGWGSLWVCRSAGEWVPWLAICLAPK